MKKWFEQFKTEDWVVVAVSILLLAFAIITPNYLPRIPKHLADTESWGNAIFLFVIVLVILYIGWLLLGRPLKGLFLSLIAVFSAEPDEPILSSTLTQPDSRMVVVSLSSG